MLANYTKENTNNPVQMYIDGSASLEYFEMDERLRRNLKPKESGLAWKVEDVLHGCLATDDLTALFPVLKGTIQKEATKLEGKWISARISRHDFESVFWEEAHYIFKAYHYYTNPDFLYYQTLRLAMNRRAKDVQRKATTTKSGFVNNRALPLSTDFEEVYADKSVNIEKEITDKMFIQALLSDKALSMNEKAFLKVMYDAPWKSISELARYAEYSHHEQATRMIKRLRKKLVKYEEAYNSDIKCDLPYGKPKKRG